MLEGLHERQGHRQRNRGGQRDPHARELGRGNGKRQHHAVREPGLRGVFLHHARVAEDLAAADVEGAVDRAFERRRPDEVVQHVADGDRLDLVAHPAGGGHQGQRLGQVPDHLERRRTGADHDAGLENDGVHRTVEEDLAHGFAGPHVGGEFGVGGVQAAQVDDPVHAGVGRGPRRSLRPSPFPWTRSPPRPPWSGPGSRARRRRPGPRAAHRRRRGCSGRPRRRPATARRRSWPASGPGP